MAFSRTQYKSLSGQTPGLATEVYTAPNGFTALVLNAQAVNTDSVDRPFSINHKRGATFDVPLVYQYSIPSKEILYVSGGSSGTLVLQSGDSLEIVGDNAVNYSLSLMEIPV